MAVRVLDVLRGKRLSSAIESQGLRGQQPRWRDCKDGEGDLRSFEFTGATKNGTDTGFCERLVRKVQKNRRLPGPYNPVVGTDIRHPPRRLRNRHSDRRGRYG